MLEEKYIYTILSVLLAVLFIAVELLSPAREYRGDLKKRSYMTNLLVFMLNNIVLITFQVTAVYAVVLSYSPDADSFSAFPIWAQGVLGVLILDFSIWVWHVLNHKLPLLWLFHKCHHSEQYLNATSALRFHVGEILLSVVWKSAVLMVFGVPLWVFLLSEFLITAFAMFHHANIALPPLMRKIVESIIITPALHRVHHSDVRGEHDNNYGVIFSWWDSFFSTMRRLVPERIGLHDTEEKNILGFLLFPLEKNK